MHTNEFVYWFQGYFELKDELESDESKGFPLTQKQIECIKRHIDIVKSVDKENTGNFILWLEGVLSLAQYSDIDSNHTTDLIRTELARIFRDVIDKSYTKKLPKDEADKFDKILDDIHTGTDGVTGKGSGPDWPKTKPSPHWDSIKVYRC